MTVYRGPLHKLPSVCITAFEGPDLRLDQIEVSGPLFFQRSTSVGEMKEVLEQLGSEYLSSGLTDMDVLIRVVNYIRVAVNAPNMTTATFYQYFSMDREVQVAGAVGCLITINNCRDITLSVVCVEGRHLTPEINELQPNGVARTGRRRLFGRRRKEQQWVLVTRPPNAEELIEIKGALQNTLKTFLEKWRLDCI